MDIGGQHGRRFVLLRHTHRPQRRPYPVCTSRIGNVRYRSFVQAREETSDTADLRCSWESHSRSVGADVGDESTKPRSVVKPLLLRIPSCSKQSAARRLLLSDKLMSCCAAGTNGCPDLRRLAFALGGWVSTEGSRCLGSMARRAKDSVAPLRRSSAGWMPARMGRLSAGVGRQASSQNSQGVVDGRVNEVCVITAALDRSAVLCG